MKIIHLKYFKRKRKKYNKIMASNTTYLDEFMDKMYLIPNDVNRYLRLIRNLDKRAESFQISLNQTQAKFLSQFKDYK